MATKEYREKAMQTKADIVFAYFYSMGPERSLMKLREHLTTIGLRVSLNTLKRYSSLYHWQDRIIDMDKKLQSKREAEAVDTVDEMNRRQAKLGMAMQSVSASGLQKLMKVPLLAGHEVAALARDGVKIERLAMGEATEREEILVKVVQPIIDQIVVLFQQVNIIGDQEERTREFALGADRIIQGLVTDG